jgi:hypothetical protein
VSQGKGCVLPDELAALGVQRHGALWQREVLLVADGEPVVFARSLVAATTIPAAWHLLHGLGGRPLAAVLFDDPRVRRSPSRRPASMPAISAGTAPCRPRPARAAGAVGAPLGLPAPRRAAPRYRNLPAGDPEPEPMTTMSTLSLRQRLSEYEKLMRLDKPIGILLLLWPTLWALWVASDGRPAAWVVAIFVVGTVLMRSAGCVINDYADKDFDGHVERTRNRPLAARRISPKEALGLAAGCRCCPSCWCCRSTA